MRSPYAWVYVVAGLLAVLMGVYGFLQQDSAIQALGWVSVVLVLVTAPFAAANSGSSSDSELMRELIGKVDGMAGAFTHYAQLSALSGDARRLLNRKQERDLLTKAIEEDLAEEDWDAAVVLTTELADRFGYRQEAEEYRARIESARYETVQRRVNAAVANLDALITGQRWDQAGIEAARIERLYPDAPRARGLVQRVEYAFEEFKTDTERRFLMAAQEERVEQAMELLAQLDQYLSAEEAERLQEVARGVIGRARENLGVQFRLAVQDRRWRHAADIGERIIESFPNSRMAAEIREKIDAIRAKAKQVGTG